MTTEKVAEFAPRVSLKILLFNDSDVFAGTERHIFDLSVALAALGHSVVVACPVPAPLADRCAAAGICVVPVAKKRMPDFAAIKTMAAELRAGRVDIIHAHNGRTHLLSVAAVKRAGRGQVVATQHFLAPNRTGRSGPKAWLANQLHRWAEHNTAAFIAISNAVKDQMLLRGDAPAEKITVVHNGTGEPEATTPERIVELRAELGVGDRPMVFCAARLQKEKDVPTLIKAFAALRFNDHGSMINDQKLRDGTEVTGDMGQGTGEELGADARLQVRGERKDPQITQITQINDPSRQVYPAGQNGSAAIPKVLISDQCSLVIERSAMLLIAGEGDQRAECERLIDSLITDQKPGDDAVAAAKNSEFRTLHSEGNMDATEIESAALPKHSRFEVLGSSSLSSAALPNNSRFQVPGSDSSSGITLLGFRSDVSALMAACDIFVLPAPAEPFGLVLIEAMALGKPVIAAAAGGPLEIVADGETGLLFEPGNAASLAQAIKRLLADPELRQRMGKAGRKRYEEKFTARRMAAGMLAAYSVNVSIDQ